MSPLPPALGVEEPTPSASPGGVGASRESPIPTGQSAEVGDWRIQVIGFTRNANSVVAHENMFNSKPRKGEQYVLVSIKATYQGSGSRDAWNDLNFKAVNRGGDVTTADTWEVIPKDIYDVGRVPSGTNANGNVMFELRPQDIDGLELYVEDSAAEGGTFFAL